jgi:hypothetical protein
VGGGAGFDEIFQCGRKKLWLIRMHSLHPERGGKSVLVAKMQTCVGAQWRDLKNKINKKKIKSTSSAMQKLQSFLVCEEMWVALISFACSC